MKSSNRPVSEKGVKDLIQPTQIEYKICETILPGMELFSDESNLDWVDFLSSYS